MILGILIAVLTYLVCKDLSDALEDAKKLPPWPERHQVYNQRTGRYEWKSL